MRHMYLFSRIFFIGLLAVQIPLSAFAQSFEPHNPPLSPSTYDLTSDYREIPSLRTEKTVTFVRPDGQAVSIGDGHDIFTHDENGDFVPIDESGYETARGIVFDRLPRDAIVTFDASSPGYTYQLGKHWLKLRYAGRAEAIFKAPNVVTYRLSDTAVLTFTVRGATVQKAITITGNVDPAVLQFSLTADPELSLRSSKDGMQLREKDGTVIFQTSAPILQDTTGKILNHPIEIVSLSSGNFGYHYDSSGLPATYVIDPNTTLNSPSTCADDASVGSVVWSGASGCSGTAVTFENSTHYFKATNFGFFVPQGSTITGIVAKVTRASNGGQTGDVGPHLVKAGTIQGGSQTYGPTDTLGSYNQFWGSGVGESTYGQEEGLGSTNDLWSGTWTAADITNSGFGFVIGASSAAEPESTVTNTVSGVKMQVYYSLKQLGDLCNEGDQCASGPCEPCDVGLWSAPCGSDPPGTLKCGSHCACISDGYGITVSPGFSAVLASNESVDMTVTSNYGSYNGENVRFKKGTTRIAEMVFGYGCTGPAGNFTPQMDTDTTNQKAYFHVPGYTLKGSGYTLYVPKSVSHDRVRVCSGAVLLGCTSTGSWSFYSNDQGQITANGGFSTTNITAAVTGGYWKINGLTSTGGGEGSGAGGTAVPEFPLVGLLAVLAGCLVFMRWKVLRRD